MSDSSDLYWRLRSPRPTPPDELCRCSERPPVVLAHHLTENPVHCFECNLEVPPEQIGFDQDLSEQLAHWNSLAGDLLDRLWLDSDEYESWAVQRLTDPAGRVNQLAANAVAALNAYVRAYHWWFVDIDTQAADCPRCGQRLDVKPTRVHTNRKVCEPCSIAVTDYPDKT